MPGACRSPKSGHTVAGAAKRWWRGRSAHATLACGEANSTLADPPLRPDDTAMPVLGNAAAQSAFRAALDGGSLHHAWLIAGPEGVGKASFAHEAAMALIGDTAANRALAEAHSHPDLVRVQREPWTTGGNPRIVPLDERGPDDKPARSIRVEQIRTLRAQLSTAPAMGRYRAVVIDAIDDLERPGANALLKSLEEPPQGTIFLLVSHMPGRLLPTIRSRCRLLRFEPLADAEVARVLRGALPEADEDEIAALTGAAEGSPGRGLRFAGLDLAQVDAAIAAIAADGDPANTRRAALARQLAPKAAQGRYDAFLDRAPAFIARAARDRRGGELRLALDAYAAARDLAGAARGLSLDPSGTVWEMAGLVARLRPA